VRFGSVGVDLTAAYAAGLVSGGTGAGQRHLGDGVMDETSGLLLLITAAAVGIVATIGIMRRQRMLTESAGRESPYAVSTEGMKRCPSCNTGNLVTDADCSNCGKPLPG
jgi:hypothetical protein